MKEQGSEQLKEQDVERLGERAPEEREVQEAISLRAYEIYQGRGGAHGNDLDDWLRAETEVLAALTEPETPGLTTGSAQTTVEIEDATGQAESRLAEAAPRKRKGER